MCIDESQAYLDVLVIHVYHLSRYKDERNYLTYKNITIHGSKLLNKLGARKLLLKLHSSSIFTDSISVCSDDTFESVI